MNEEQKAWFEKLKALVNAGVEDVQVETPGNLSQYETFIERIQEQLDTCPKP